VVALPIEQAYDRAEIRSNKLNYECSSNEGLSVEVAMSAMGAPELPEIPTASSQDSARIRAVTHWTWTAQVIPAAAVPGRAPLAERVPVPAAPPERRPVPAARPVPPRGRAARSPAARSPAVRLPASRPQPASVPLRLTRRGRVVATIAAVLLLAVLSLVIAASAQATNHAPPSGAVQHNLTRVTVRPGQSLWSIAENADPDADTRVVIQQIIELNGLTGNVVFAGQRLWVPRG
jgi:LysM domain